MTSAVQPLYPSRAAAGAQLGRHVYQRVRPPLLVLGVTPTGVEIAAHVAKAMSCPFDVIVASHVRVEGAGIVGALAEDADAVLDPEFQPGFGVMEALNQGIENARRAIKSERLLFRGPRPLRAVTAMTVVVVDGQLTTAWKTLAAASAVEQAGAAGVLVAAPLSTRLVHDLMLARRVDFVCPSVLSDPAGHPHPFGDPRDPSAERLRSIVVAREAA
jgi:predicted phosphoribosyltransferase